MEGQSETSRLKQILNKSVSIVRGSSTPSVECRSAKDGGKVPTTDIVDELMVGRRCSKGKVARTQKKKKTGGSTGGRVYVLGGKNTMSVAQGCLKKGCLKRENTIVCKGKGNPVGYNHYREQFWAHEEEGEPDGEGLGEYVASGVTWEGMGTTRY